MLIFGLKTQKLNQSVSVLRKYEEIYYFSTHKYVGRHPNDVYELDQWFSVNDSFLSNANLFPDKLSSQYGRGCEVGFFQYSPYVVYDKNGPIKERIKGYEGFMLNAFAEHHNIATKPRFFKDYWGDVFDNGSVYGLRGALFEDVVDIGIAAFFSTDRMYRYFGMTQPTLRLGITCLVPAPKLTAGWLVPILVYSNLMWKLIFTGYIIITLSIYVAELRFISQKSECLTYERSINTREDFLESNISWGGVQVADKLMHWATDREEKYRRAFRRYLAAPSEAELKKLLASGNFGLLIERIPGNHYHFPFISLKQSKGLRTMKEDLYWEFTVFLLRKSSILIPLLDKFIFRMNQAGISIRWIDQATHLTMNQSSQIAAQALSRYNSPGHQVVVLRLDHVAGVFCILVAGNMIAFLIFCLELLYYSQSK